MCKTTTCKKITKKILQCSELKTDSINYNSCHAGAGIREQARRVTDWGGEEVGDGKAEGSSATGGRRAICSAMHA